jgi:hypothetical protein
MDISEDLVKSMYFLEISMYLVLIIEIIQDILYPRIIRGFEDYPMMLNKSLEYHLILNLAT